MIFFLPALTGLLLMVSFPRIDQGYAAWVAFIPLTVFLVRGKSVKAAFAGGLIAGFLQFFALLIWMPAVLMQYGGLSPWLSWLAYVLLVMLLACYPAAACALGKFVMRRRGERYLLIFPFLWIVFEYLQSFTPFGGLPWLTAGYSQHRFLHLIQIADITGIYGISFLLVWTAVAIVWLFRHKHGPRAWIPAAAAVILLAGSAVYGSVSLARWGNPSPRFDVAMLQGNISYDDPPALLLDKFQAGYIRMADHLKRPLPDLLLLPESPSPTYFESDFSYRQAMEKLAERFRFGVVLNNVSSRGTGAGIQYFNSAYFLSRNGILEGVYDKIHLVPFGEYIPLRKVFSFIEVISKDVETFAGGSEYRIVNIGGRPANAVICFEAVFPRLVSRFVLKGSQLIVSLTNDGWYGDSSAPYQHLAIARLRAVENRRYLLRATNTGISAVIEPTGRIQTSTGILRKAVCRGRFDFNPTVTPYTRYGDVFVFLCVIISCGSVISAGLHSSGTHKSRA